MCLGWEEDWISWHFEHMKAVCQDLENILVSCLYLEKFRGREHYKIKKYIEVYRKYIEVYRKHIEVYRKYKYIESIYGRCYKDCVILTVQYFLRQNARIQDLYSIFLKWSYQSHRCIIISDAPKYDIIWTKNSDVFDGFISEVLKYKYWILEAWHKRSGTLRFTQLHF